MMHIVRFLHLPIWGYTAVLPIFGAVTVTKSQSAMQLFLLLMVATAFHNYAYVLNDLIDLPIDRTQTSRMHYPLVEGTISIRMATVFAIVNFIVAFLFAFLLTQNFWAYGSLMLAFLLMTIYDLWGKRFVIPPITDFIQGVGWGMLILFGATAVSDQINLLTGSVILFIIVYILLVNGVNGALRDFENDKVHHARTTPIWFGVEALAEQKRQLPMLFRIYALCLQILLLAIGLNPLFKNMAYQTRNLLLNETIICYMLIGVICLPIMLYILRTPQDKHQIFPWLMTSNICMLLLLFILFLPIMNQLTLTVTLGVFILPLVLSDWLLSFGSSSVSEV